MAPGFSGTEVPNILVLQRQGRMMRKLCLQTVAATMMLAVSMAALAQGGERAGRSAPPQAKQEQPKSSVKDVYRSEHAYFGDRFTIVPSIQYSHSDRDQLDLSGFYVLDAIFLGRLNVDDVSFDTIQTSISFRYDLTDSIQIQATVPYLFRRAHFETIGVGGSSERSAEATVYDNGLGDVSARVYWHALQETASMPDVVLYVGGRAPTGDDPYGISTNTKASGNLEYPTELPMGNGVWSVFVGASVLKTFDPAILFASFGYEHTFPQNFDDLTTGAGNVGGEVDLGDTYRFGLGMAFALNRKLSLSISYSHAFITEAEETPNGGSTQNIVGSQGHTGALNLGMTLAVSDSSSLVANIGVGVTEDAPDITLSFSVPFTL